MSAGLPRRLPNGVARADGERAIATSWAAEWGCSAGQALSCPERPPSRHDVDQALGGKPLQHPVNYAGAYLVVLSQRGHSRQRLVGLPLAAGNAVPQVSFNPLARPLRCPVHLYMITRVNRDLRLYPLCRLYRFYRLILVVWGIDSAKRARREV
jgi:hypothetical protein